jgi:nicotinamide riboside kinase
MKVFVIGYTNTGKTTLAARIATALELPMVRANEWVEASLGSEAVEYASKTDRAQVYTQYSTDHLRVDPAVALRYMSTRFDVSRPCVIEGLRNPRDFLHLYDPRFDLVVLVDRVGVTASSVFESGVDHIADYLRYLDSAGLMSTQNQHSVIRCLHEDFGASVETACATVVARARSRLRRFPCQTKTEPVISVDIEPFVAMVRKEYFYDMDAAYEGQYIKAEVFSLSGYPGDVPTFSVITEEEGAVFSYIPPSALKHPDTVTPDVWLGLDDLVYHNCPQGPIAVSVHERLRGSVQAYFKRRDEWWRAQYLLTLDWYEGNDLLHLVLLENGQYAFLPSHKLLFNRRAVRTLPDYRKMHSQWKCH